MPPNRFASSSAKESVSPDIQPGSLSGPALEYYSPPTWRECARGIKRELRIYREVAGSTLLFDMANRHPDVQCEKNAKETELLRDRFLWPHRYIEARASLSPAKVYGFKLQLGHLTIRNPTDPRRFIQNLSAGGWKMVYLTRRDMLRQAISLAIAQQTRIWHRVQTASNGWSRTIPTGKKCT